VSSSPFRGLGNGDEDVASPYFLLVANVARLGIGIGIAIGIGNERGESIPIPIPNRSILTQLYSDN
jgi:hypothetical protein